MTTAHLPSDETILALFEDLALAAGRAIMAVYATDFDTRTKADASPVTEADRAAEAIILEGLRAALPGVVCVAEEEVADGKVPAALGSAFILVDPLDGTKEFVGRKGDFTVNIALVRDGVPSVGAVYAPARNVLYTGRPGEATIAEVTPEGVVVGRRPMAARRAASPPRIVASRSHRTPETDAFIDGHPGAETVSVGSSLKFCLLANGEADLYPRFGRTMEWDTAAGDAVLRAAGGSTSLVDGGAFVYGKRDQADDVDFANPWFIARGA
ncbi:3'(2'),5'-bisphosphate nucleotidase CysQ [Aquibium sp. ELW1220]|uniref:3'(2'),5'-bisphosphate nucleotidase CysQ n=1 Tax=Aquibium sp. ELW1220 TaxID=2976766 RepID=UPI0025B2658B|nr:3'(2'),5'-bisphosphate nucleotidase CysQ [Aquibium sp. ELW1220]MDN2582179.1 3'(2'),5'-bisphosphate nucleotidase CysQ [Aquibium sp. ELW1220]